MPTMVTIRRLFVVVVLFGVVSFAAAGGAGEVATSTIRLESAPLRAFNPERDAASITVGPVDLGSGAVPVAWRADIFDGGGTPVWTAGDRESERVGRVGTLLGRDKPRVDVPTTMLWEGRYRGAEAISGNAPSDGEVVPDGAYYWQLTVYGDGGEVARTAPVPITVDRTPPRGRVATGASRIISPNDDGVQESTPIALETSPETSWRAQIADETGAPVRELAAVSDGALPASLSWDGRDADGTPVPDGRYTVRLVGRDAAGNEAMIVGTDAITVSVAAPALTLVAEAALISPNGDGRLDTTDVAIVADASDVPPVSWEIAVRRNGRTIARDGAVGAPPATWTFDGRFGDGTAIPDGPVTLVASLQTANGVTVASPPATVTIDTTPPRGTVGISTEPEGNAAATVFGAGIRERVSVVLDLDDDATWRWALSRDGESIAEGPIEQLVAGLAPARVGALAAEEVRLRWRPGEPGLYELSVRGEDGAGNRAALRPVRARFDPRTPTAAIDQSVAIFSPRGTGPMAVVFDLAVEAPEMVEELTVAVHDTNGRVVAARSVPRALTGWSWDGRIHGGATAPDGEYRVTLDVAWQNGHRAQAIGGEPILLDATAPEVTRLRAPWRRFSPDGDGERDVITIDQAVAGDERWVGTITTEDRQLIRTWEWTTGVGPVTWDGRDDRGQIVADGIYRYTLRATDVAGNVGTASIDVEIDTVAPPVSQTPPAISVSAGPRPFSPDGDGIADRATITIGVEAESPATRWRVEVAEPEGGVVRAWSGPGAPPASIAWNGVTAAGDLVESAVDYRVAVTVWDANGNEGRGATTLPTDILVLRDGDRLRIRVASILFAPNTADLFRGSSDQIDRNLATLRRLAQILNRYPDRVVSVEGHAAHVVTWSAAAMEREHRTELLPLSAGRADEVAKALIILGVDAGRLRTAGFGGAVPVVPHEVAEGRWRNRRVEFVLEAPSL